MKQLALLVTLFTFAPSALAADATTRSTSDPMAGWVPRKVTREVQDRKEIAALFAAMHRAGEDGDVNAAAALVDFPVLMVTDDSKGEAKTDSWDKGKWLEVMRQFYRPKPGVKMTYRPTIFLLTDSLASVTNQWTMTVGQKRTTGRSATLLVRTSGQWRIKSMAEGGWGDMMEGKPATASQPAEPSGTGTAAPSEEPARPGSSPADTQGTGAQPTK